jgi:hypothetical protein
MLSAPEIPESRGVRIFYFEGWIPGALTRLPGVEHHELTDTRSWAAMRGFFAEVLAPA